MWSRIQNTQLSRAAKEHISLNDQRGCEYHNWNHIESMYQYLEDTNEPYDECLDWAVLFHDIVYDNQIEKEYRSAVMFSDMKEKYSGCDLSPLDEGNVATLIMATEKHLVSYPGYSPIVRADLNALVNTVQTFRNFGLIMDESIALYGIDELTFAENNIKFMVDLYDRVQKNMETDLDHREFYKQVMRGIVSTINLARIVKGDL